MPGKTVIVCSCSVGRVDGRLGSPCMLPSSEPRAPRCANCRSGSVRLPPGRQLADIRVRSRLEFDTIHGIEHAHGQRDHRLVVHGAEGAATGRTERPARTFGRAPGGRRAARPRPADALTGKLDPRERQRARVPLAHLARAGMGLERRAEGGEPDVPAQAAADMGLDRCHGIRGLRVRRAQGGCMIAQQCSGAAGVR